jgi:hypothetical protein
VNRAKGFLIVEESEEDAVVVLARDSLAPRVAAKTFMIADFIVEEGRWKYLVEVSLDGLQRSSVRGTIG